VTDTNQNSPVVTFIPRHWWRPQVEFLIEIVTGTAIFGVVAGVAVLASLWVKYLERQGTDIAIIYGMTAAEYLLFLADVGLFTRFIWRAFCRTWKSL
jgi:hypothetical protein